MFIGEYDYSLDSKSRLVIPSKYREGLGTHFVVTKNKDQCLDLYTPDRWAKMIEHLSALPYNDPAVRKYARFYIAGACELEPDKQWRVIIPQKLRDFAGIQKDVIFMGVGDRIEIWSRELYAKVSEEDDIDAIEQSLLNRGFML